MMFSTCFVLFQKVSITFDFVMTNTMQIIDHKNARQFVYLTFLLFYCYFFNKTRLKCNGKMIIIEIDPNTGRGKQLKNFEDISHTGAKF